VGVCTRELSLTAGNRRATSPAGRRHDQNLQLHKLSQELIAVTIIFNKLRNKKTFEQIDVQLNYNQNTKWQFENKNTLLFDTRRTVKDIYVVRFHNSLRITRLLRKSSWAESPILKITVFQRL